MKSRSGTFYTRVFGWDFSPFQAPEDYWPITGELLADWEAAAKPGINTGGEAATFPIQAIAVVSLEEASLRIINQGGKVLTAPILVPGSGYLLYCQDASGNAFGILEPNDGSEFPELDREPL